MTLQRTIIEGVTITPLKIIADNRGAVLHMLRKDAEEYTGFGECYFSEVLPGAVKAWKKHSIQTQNFAVPVGQLSLVIFDNRQNSSSAGQLLVIPLGRPDHYCRVQVPPGLWYGFTCTSDVPALLVNCADHVHIPAESEVLDKNDASIPYLWSENGAGDL